MDYVVQAARGLEFAHQNGVIHRDIKPHNLLLGKDGVVKLLDLGLARVEDPLSTERETTLTSTGAVLGTVDYMAPEQAEDTKATDVRSDIYGLGCTLFYLLTGRVVYPGDTMMKRLIAHREAPLPSLVDALEARNPKARSSSAATLDSRLSLLDTVFRRMIAKRPADRQASMTEIIADLQRFLAAPITKAAQQVAVVEDAKFSDFFAMLREPDNATALEGTPAFPLAGIPFADERSVQFQDATSDTDPATLTNISATVRHRKRKTAWFRDPIRIAILIVAAYLLHTL